MTLTLSHRPDGERREKTAVTGTAYRGAGRAPAGDRPAPRRPMIPDYYHRPGPLGGPRPGAAGAVPLRLHIAEVGT